MTHYIANISFYDCMGDVMLGCTVHDLDGPDGTLTQVLTCGDQVQGTGEDNPREWLRDALVAMLEVL